MACDDPKEQWTIETVTDPRPNKPPVTATLVFCLSFDDGIISGEVADGISGDLLSDVSGKRESLGSLGLDETASLMTLNYRNGQTRVMMSGVTFEKNFRGRFTTYEAAELAATGPVSRLAVVLPQAGGDGDTGTGTGTQT